MRRIPATVLTLATLLAAGTLPAPAQQTIVISKPADISPDKANNFMDSPSRRANNSHNAPRSLFNNNVSPDLPAPRTVNYQPHDPAVQEALNKRKNWTLLTPEEILGIQTPEQVLGISADKNKTKLTLEEKFLQRQIKTGPTNGIGRADSPFSKDDNNPFTQNSRNREDRDVFSRDSARQLDERGDSSLTRLLDHLNKNKTAQDPYSISARRENSPWASDFANPTTPPRSSDQLSSMERFRAMLEPPPSAQPAGSTARFPTTPITKPDSYLQPQPKINPNGRTVTSLEDNSSRPTGITPLPGVTGSTPITAPKRPEWQAQLPPWLVNKPQTIDQKRANGY